MTKKELADELRGRQRTKGTLPPEIKARLADFPDDFIIASYITCADCGVKQVANESDLNKIIAASQNAEGFFALCDHYAAEHNRSH